MAEEKEKSKFFGCPHCSAINRKSDVDLMMGRTRGVILGPTEVPCHQCRHLIDRRTIVNGTYDVPPPSGCSVSTILILLAIGGSIIWLLSRGH